MGPKLDLHTVDEDGAVVVGAKGDIDLHTATQLRDHALEALPAKVGRLVLDFSNVGFLDSSGIGVMVLLRKTAIERGGTAHVVPSRRVRAALKLASLDQVFAVHDTIQAALTADLVDPA